MLYLGSEGSICEGFAKFGLAVGTSDYALCPDAVNSIAWILENKARTNELSEVVVFAPLAELLYELFVEKTGATSQAEAQRIFRNFVGNYRSGIQDFLKS